MLKIGLEYYGDVVALQISVNKNKEKRKHALITL